MAIYRKVLVNGGATAPEDGGNLGDGAQGAPVVPSGVVHLAGGPELAGLAARSLLSTTDLMEDQRQPEGRKQPPVPAKAVQFRQFRDQYGAPIICIM